jgi:hypothetical protein
MVELVPYHATDRRVYNGAFCSDMTREKNHKEELLAELLRLCPQAKVTYFPMEGYYDVSIRHEEPGKLWFECVYSNYDKQLAIIGAIHKIIENNA